jgi:hypothetical protein
MKLKIYESDELQQIDISKISLSNSKYKSKIIYDLDGSLNIKFKNILIASPLYYSNYSKTNQYHKCTFKLQDDEQLHFFEMLDAKLFELAKDINPNVTKLNSSLNTDFKSISVRITDTLDLYNTQNDSPIPYTNTSLVEYLTKNTLVNALVHLQHVTYYNEQCYIVLCLKQVKVLDHGNQVNSIEEKSNVSFLCEDDD